MEDIKLKCSFCEKEKSWEEFHYGKYNETTPLVCIDCLREGRVKRTFMFKTLRG